MSFITGPYTATYNSVACGQSADGYRVSHSFFKRLIQGDGYAQAPQDEIYQGAEMFIQFRMIEYNAAAVASAMWPYGSYLTHGQVGRVSVQQSLVKSLVLTAVAGTPAASEPATLTLPKSILSEGFPVELLYAPDLREVPIRMRVFPSGDLPSASATFGVAT
ncbi:MAG: hypothetical protein H8E44_04400 [Planctomycetes bacterium]|nr:hypothetical protein [Planctomycetota bacterium]